MTVQEIENKVWEQDGNRIIVRDRSSATVGKYVHRNTAQGRWRITESLNSRIGRLVKDREVVVLDGKGKMPNGRTLLKTIRQSYSGNGSFFNSPNVPNKSNYCWVLKSKRSIRWMSK